MPAFALDGGEEAEIAMLYLVDDGGRPRRVGYALGNEFSDHVLERQNYLYLAHHHFKSPLFRPPGDVHVHFIGAAVLSFTAGLRTEEGDVFEIAAEPFGT